MDTNHRIFEELDKRGLKSKELSLKTGIATSTISEWKKGVALKPDMLVRVAEILKVSVDYLLTGLDKIDSLSPEETEFVKKYRSLGSNDKAVITALMDNYIDKMEKYDKILNLLNAAENKK